MLPPAGNEFSVLARNCEFVHLVTGTRSFSSDLYSPFFVDLENPLGFRWPDHFSSDIYIVSFAPIWLLASFLQALDASNPELFADLKGIIACSSSSVLSKRFSFNLFDKELSSKLNISHDQLHSICQSHAISCTIVCPSMVYGHSGNYSDRNVSQLTRIVKYLPLLVLPSFSGQRQPIHCSQLSDLFFHFLTSAIDSNCLDDCPRVLAVGGDETLTYRQMLMRLSLLNKSSFFRCRFVIAIPYRFFAFLLLPFAIMSPKLFEALLRLRADLSGFTPFHSILGVPPSSFPLSGSSN